ncbi:hypothetical protein KKC88_04540 [Patescibacteria group bacterium]|nr:hypothetical protein [Patescibacteria group bacterium]MBU1673999.1 hypothetical protein [Patescibacteria group bacterium]MBU1962928.1 hypothetical protein [Patescibacteria group bacterium]
MPNLETRMGSKPATQEGAKQDRKIKGVRAEQPTQADADALQAAFPDKKIKQAIAAQDADQIAAVKKKMGVDPSVAQKRPGETTGEYKTRLSRYNLEENYGAPKKPVSAAAMKPGEVMVARKDPGQPVQPVEEVKSKLDDLMSEYVNLRTKMKKLEGKGFAFFKKARLNRLKQMEGNLNTQVAELTPIENRKDARALYDRMDINLGDRMTANARAEVEKQNASYMEAIGPALEARRVAEAEKSLGEAAAAREEEMAAYRPITDVEENITEKQPDVTEQLELIEEKPDVSEDLELVDETKPTRKDMEGAIQARKILVEDMGEIEAGDDEPTDEEIAAQMEEINLQLAEEEKAARMAKYPKAIKLKEGTQPEPYAGGPTLTESSAPKSATQVPEKDLPELKLDDEVEEIELDEDDKDQAASA